MTLFRTVADRNPCPVCGGVPQNLPGVLLRNGDESANYFVCWRDNMAKKRAQGETWKKLSAMSQQPEWKKFSATHWQMQIDGELLDYWPTKRKWRFRDQTQTGNIAKFIAKLTRAA